MPLTVSKDVRSALREGRGVVALESTLIAHGLPWPMNRDTAFASEDGVRQSGAVPATVAVWGGVPTVGLNREQIESLAKSDHVRKASRRDLATAVLRKEHAATTVAATMALAHMTGISVFATGGIGGVHPDAVESFDVSADLTELSRTPVLVVCAGAKNILDLPRTLELLETLGVPVVGYRTDEFPAFYVRTSGLPVSARVDSESEAAELFAAHREYGAGGMVLAQPIAESAAISDEEFRQWLRVAESEGVAGPARTPRLLKRLAELSGGRTVAANRELIVANAALAGRIAVS